MTKVDQVAEVFAKANLDGCETPFVSRAGTYDAIIGSDGQEVDVYIVEDTPTFAVVEILGRGARLRLAKHVQ